MNEAAIEELVHTKTDLEQKGKQLLEEKKSLETKKVELEESLVSQHDQIENLNSEKVYIGGSYLNSLPKFYTTYFCADHSPICTCKTGSASIMSF